MQKKSEKCYMTFKITPFCKKEKEKIFGTEKQNYIKVNRSQLKIIFFCNTIRWVMWVLTPFVRWKGCHSLQFSLMLLLLLMFESSFAFLFLSLTIECIYALQMGYLLCKSVHIYRKLFSSYTNVHHVTTYESTFKWIGEEELLLYIYRIE